jgi:hypothetical protein
MATAGLALPRPQFPCGLARAWGCCYIAMWCITALSALAVGLSGNPVQAGLHRMLGMHLAARLAPRAGLMRVVFLLAHNLPAFSWPLLLGVRGDHRRRASRTRASLLLTAVVCVNVALVGAAFGVLGTRLVAFVPQLPAEWAAYSLGASTWIVQLRRPLTAAHRRACFSVLVALALIAAILETFAVPHR